MNRSRIFLWTLFLLFITTTIPVQAQNFPGQPSGHVNDYAEVLAQTDEQQLEHKLRAYRDSTSNVIAIAIVESLQGYSREEVANTIFNNWRMWEGDRYNGVLILVAPNEREMQIEVGYGLEGAVTDLMANRIVDQILRPNFRNNNFYGGLNEASTAIMRLAAGEYEAVEEQLAEEPVILVIFFIIILVIIILFFSFIAHNLKKGSGGKYHTIGSGGIVWGGGSSSGGFGGGGGGFGGFSGGGGFGSGGGGAGGGW